MYDTVVIFIFLLSTGYCERLHNQIYSPIDGAAACFRRLNATHQTGCSSPTENGAVGTIQWVMQTADAEWLAKGGSGGAPYVALVSTFLFNTVVETLIARPDNVAGVILYDNQTEIPPYFSPESQCPNQYTSGPGSKCGAPSAAVWNSHGSGLLQRNIPFPIFYLPSTRHEEVDKLVDCYKRFNERNHDSQSSQPLCSVQLSSFMFAAVNTEVCMRRSIATQLSTKQCDPIGDRNIYASLFRRSQDMKEANRSVILVTARIDSASLFDGLSPGAASSAVGVVTFLTAARTLAAMLPPESAATYGSNVLWTLFSGESFDYIGSQRVAHDMLSGEWPPGAPLSAASVALHVELGQLGGALAAAGRWQLDAFAPLYNEPEDEEVRQFISLLQQSEPNLTISAHLTSNLPPSSLHSFRRILGETPSRGGLPELLIVDHGATSLSNRYYQSVLDDKRNVRFNYTNTTLDEAGDFLDTTTMIARGHLTNSSMQVKISMLANAVARALYQRVTGTAYNGSAAASAHMVDELLHCYLETANCRMFTAAEYGPVEGATSESVLPHDPYPLYSDVHAWPSQAPHTTGLLLALLTGRVNGTDSELCPNRHQKDYTFTWLNGWNNSGVCVQSTLNFSDALSPAFTIPDYNLTSGKYSTWTESQWRAMSARMFVAPSGRGARLAALTGAAATLLVGTLTYWLHRHSDVIFPASRAAAVSESVDSTTAGILRTVNC